MSTSSSVAALSASTSSSVSTSCHPAPGDAAQSSDPTLKQRVLESGASFLQSIPPLQRPHAHLCALHAYGNDINRQVIAHHVCTHLSEEMHQCLLFDSADAKAKLVGVEYLISERLLLTLDEDEQRLWHSHKFEVESGMLVMPGLPEVMERPMMREVGSMYGKIICTWQTDRHALPIGPPQLMTSLTCPDVVNRQLMEEKDRQTSISSEERRKAREGAIKLPSSKPPLIDAWERGELLTFDVKVEHIQG